MLSEDAKVIASNLEVAKPLLIVIPSTRSDHVANQAKANTALDETVYTGGDYKKFFEIIFLNKKYIIHSHKEEDAINIFLKNNIFKRDNILKIKQIESMTNNKNKKNIIFKDKNYQLYIVRGFKKGIFVKI